MESFFYSFFPQNTFPSSQVLYVLLLETEGECVHAQVFGGGILGICIRGE